nr:unnamed protein product [Haemonchus contortus]
MFYAVGKKSQHLEFKIRKTPHTIAFDNVAVVTNSDNCNEVARVFLSQGLSMFAMAFSMQLCLMAYELHRSGLGGSSAYVHLDASKGECTTLSTFDATDRQYMKALGSQLKTLKEQSHSSNHTGNHKEWGADDCFEFRFGKPFNTVVDVAREIVTLRSLFKKIPGEERESTIRLIKLYVFRVLTKSSSLRVVEEANKDELELLSVTRFANNKTGIRQLLEEALVAELDWKFLYTMMRKLLKPRCRYETKEEEKIHGPDYFEIDWEDIESHEEKRNLDWNDSICISKDIGFGIPKGVVHHGNIISQNGSYFNNLWTNTLMILHYMENFYYNIVTENLTKYYEQLRVSLTKYYEQLRVSKPLPEAQVSGGGATSQARERRGNQWRGVGNK